MSRYIDFWPKSLLFRTHHLWNSTTELTLVCTYKVRNIERKRERSKYLYPYCPHAECMQLQSELIGIFSEGRHFMQNIQPFNFWCQKELNKPMRLHWAHKNPYSCTRPIILSILAGVSVKVFVMSTEQAWWLITVIVVRNRNLHFNSSFHGSSEKKGHE